MVTCDSGQYMNIRRGLRSFCMLHLSGGRRTNDWRHSIISKGDEPHEKAGSSKRLGYQAVLLVLCFN